MYTTLTLTFFLFLPRPSSFSVPFLPNSFQFSLYADYSEYQAMFYVRKQMYKIFFKFSFQTRFPIYKYLS